MTPPAPSSAAAADGPASSSHSTSSGGQSSAKSRQTLTARLRSMIADTIKSLHVPMLVYGTISAVIASTPPTCSLTLQGTSVVIAGVRFPSSYYPVAGDVVYCARVGTDLFVMGKIATSPGTTAAGHLGAPYTVTGSMATFLSTAALGVGTWAVRLGACVNLGGAGAGVIQVVAGTATATVEGKLSSDFANPVASASTALTDGVLDVIATVTAAGTLAFQAQLAAGAMTIRDTTPSFALPGATGYTAVRQA